MLIHYHEVKSISLVLIYAPRGHAEYHLALSDCVPQPPLDLKLSEILLSCYAFEFLESSGWKEPCRMMTLNMGRLTFPVVKL